MSTAQNHTLVNPVGPERGQRRHALAWRMARACRHVVQTCLREEEWLDADEEFYRLILAGLNEADDGSDVNTRLKNIEALLATLVERPMAKDFYQIEEFAQRVGKASFTVREWARLGRIKASKRQSGRGSHCTWAISHHELQRYEQHGLLPRSR